MTPLTFHIPGEYENPLTPSGRGRTIAAFHLAQGDVDELAKTDMRRDILTKLMSSSAVNYWLNTQGWLEKSKKVGKIQLLKLTSKGLVTCRNSLAGGADVPTTKELVQGWRTRMKNGAASFSCIQFPPLPENEEDA